MSQEKSQGDSKKVTIIEEKDKKRIKKEHWEKLKKHKEHEYFQGHTCSLSKEQKSKDEIKCGKFRRFIMKLMYVRSSDIRARNIFRSNSAFKAEIQRHYSEFPYTIHPYSWLRLIVEIIVAITFFFSYLITSLYYAESKSVAAELYNTLLTCDFIYVIFVIINFFTGYEEGFTSKYIVLSLKKIAWKYITTWLLFDFLYLSRNFFVTSKNYKLRPIVLSRLAKIIRLPTLFKFTHNILNVVGASEVTKTTIHLILMIGNYLAWNIILQFAVEFLIEDSYSPQSPRKCSWLTVTQLWNGTLFEKYVFSAYRAVGMLRQNSNLNIFKYGGCDEIFFIISWAIGRLICVHFALKYMLMIIGQQSARARYFIMAQQVKTYVEQRRYPERIKRKILKYYAVRYQSAFVSEQRIMSCMSGQLREDIIMHTSRQLVSEVEFLKKLPRTLLLQIGTKLKVVIFLAGDIIFKINTLGDYLYFIDKGTVAIYSESGKEICHLQDGDFFGEIALVMKSRFRTASAVAVTHCELFRLDKTDFERTIACYPTVYENIKKVALQRMEITKVLDEHHKAELKTGQEDTDTEPIEEGNEI